MFIDNEYYMAMDFYEFRNRLEEAGAKIYMLVEGGSIDKIYSGDYDTKVNPKSYVATFFACLARYNCQIVFCEANKSGYVIHDILYRELK